MASSPDLGEFEALSKPSRRFCPLEQVAETLNDAEAAKLAAALETGSTVITNKAIESWLAKRGHKVHWAKVRAHRGHICSCYRDE